jgi:hypothetical protein
MAEGRLARIRRLPPEERRLLLAAWLALTVTPAALALVSFRRLCAWAERAPTRAGVAPWPSPERAAELVEAAARHHLVRASCLARALVLCRLLRRRGHPARLVLAGARSAGRFEAHAWIDCAGTPLTAGAQIGRFTPLLRGGHATEPGSDSPRGQIATPCSSTASMEGRDTR